MQTVSILVNIFGLLTNMSVLSGWQMELAFLEIKKCACVYSTLLKRDRRASRLTVEKVVDNLWNTPNCRE